jgi:hypothetical protein
MRRAFYDGRFSDATAYQHMCAACVESGAELWEPMEQPTPLEQPSPPQQPSIDEGRVLVDTDEYDDELAQQAALVEAQVELDTAPSTSTAIVAPPPPLLPAPLAPPLPSGGYLSHGGKVDGVHQVGEVKGTLGKALAAEITPRLPRVQRDGSLEASGTNSRTSTSSSSALLEAFEASFPHAPLYEPPRAEQRARSLKKGALWAEQERIAAAACFAAEAAGITPMLIVPEVVGRRELLADVRFRAPGGCLCICPSCETNTYVKPDGLNTEEADKLRFAWGEQRCYMAIYSNYICFNPACSAVMDKLKDKPGSMAELHSAVDDGIFLRRGGPVPDERLGKGFSALDPRLINELLPGALRARLEVTFFAGQQGGLDRPLAAKLLRSREDVSEMADAIAASRAAREEGCLQRYIAFADAERRAEEARTPTAMELFTGATTSGASAAVPLWPPFRFHHPTDSILHPTRLNLTTAIKELGSQLKPYLLGDLLRRAPGEFASSDGTFRLALRTISDAGTLLFIMGERHDIVAWYALKNESWSELYAGLLRLRARLQRLGMLDALKFWYDDRCCTEKGGCECAQAQATARAR